MKIINPDKCVVFFDFDNTIATCDVFDSMLPVFSRNNIWVKLEKAWEAGKIGSYKCLKGQLSGMVITNPALDSHLSSIKLDPYFKKLVKALSSKKIKVIILSDNFDYILKRILHIHGIRGLKIYANKLHFRSNRLVALFPYRNQKCEICAHCKTKNLLANVSGDSKIIYIGDGRTDICPAQYADIVFAKDSLLKHFQDKKLACFAYKSLKDIYAYFKGVF
ncbi:MAG: MtnX-like HAD-IB family phosphatase [Candidatus Omnitrophica bacterium]|nr:MtnX-like HAD-IB family phosphatase [Candidatus Omnitrophota bacterium]